ncbi:MAG: hypothetical protein ACRCUT_03230 [Spirochaetota bacterium]
MSGNTFPDIDLEPVTSDDEDLPLSEEDLNFIRNRTFNSELRGLVEKVISEKQRLPQPPAPGEKIEISENEALELPSDIIDTDESEEICARSEIIRRLHDLFYKTANLSESGGTAAVFNPFLLRSQDLYHYSIECIRKECAKLNISEYALLFFDPQKKAYIPRIFKITSFNIHNLVLSPEESLYREILSEKKGVVITTETAPTYPELKQRLRRDFPFKGSVYCVLIQNLLMNIWQCADRPQISDQQPGNLYPVLIALSPDPKADRDYIFSRLGTTTAFSLYIVNNTVLNETIPAEFRNPSFLCSMIDTYGRMYGSHPGAKCLYLRFSGRFDNQSYVLMNYLDNKLFSLISSNSAVLHYEKNKMLIFLTLEDREKVEKYLESFLHYFGDSITIEEIRELSRMNLFDLLT